MFMDEAEKDVRVASFTERATGTPVAVFLVS